MSTRYVLISVSGPEWGGYIAWGKDPFARRRTVPGQGDCFTAARRSSARVLNEIDARAIVAGLGIRLAETPEAREPEANEIVAWFEDAERVETRGRK